MCLPKGWTHIIQCDKCHVFDIIFALNIAGVFFALNISVLLGGALWRASGAQKLFVYTSQSHIIGFQSSNQRDNQRLFLMHFMGRKKHLMLYPRGKVSDFD